MILTSSNKNSKKKEGGFTSLSLSLCAMGKKKNKADVKNQESEEKKEQVKQEEEETKEESNEDVSEDEHEESNEEDDNEDAKEEETSEEKKNIFDKLKKSDRTKKKKKKNENLVIKNLDSGTTVFGKSPQDYADVIQKEARSPAIENAYGAVKKKLNVMPEVEGEYSQDPQWAIFKDHYESLCLQESKPKEVNGITAYKVDLSASHDTGHEKDSDSLLSLLTKHIGDITSVSIPIGYIEPQSFLQRLGEAFRYYPLLDKAAASDSPSERLAYVAAFFVSSHAGNIRETKPFNPLLGETFEMVLPKESDHIDRILESEGVSDNFSEEAISRSFFAHQRTGECSSKEKEKYSFRFVAEQVSHHPPIAACHASGTGWVFNDEKRVSSKFGGNSLTLKPQGTFHLLFDDGEEITWDPVQTCAHNVVIGSLWVDHFGGTVLSSSSGWQASLSFEKCGWLSKNRYEVSGVVKDPSGVSVTQLSGKWNTSFGVVGKEPLWRVAESKGKDKYHFSPFTHSLNAIGDVRLLPATDSRLRPDRMCLEQQHKHLASQGKQKLEKLQRQAKKQRIEEELEWKPRYFEQKDNDKDPNAWYFIGSKYWEQREIRLNQFFQRTEEFTKSRRRTKQKGDLATSQQLAELKLIDKETTGEKEESEEIIKSPGRKGGAERKKSKKKLK